MPLAWDLLIARDAFSKTDLVERSVPEPGEDEVLLKVDRVGMTANNVTYALAGDALDYWSFFPADEGWGRVPLWGFADVVASNVAGVEVGARVYGYLPTSSHLVVRPDRVSPGGFTDASENRAHLPRVYNRYALSDGDPSYSHENEDLQILYRPLFFTSFMLDDFLDDNGFFGAEQLVVSSASSKTAYGTAFCTKLRAERPRLVALTSSSNVAFTETLGCYDKVFSYDDLESIPADAKALYVDVAGNQKLRVRIHDHFGDNLVYDAVVGAAHMEGLTAPPPEVSGPQPEFFFAPTQIQKRRQQWGPGELDKRYAEVWARFTPTVRNWVEIKESAGPEGLRAAWLEALAGGIDPKTGNVIAL
ncbi:MAG: DUF2855 family protein [Actinomycetota bacterium]